MIKGKIISGNFGNLLIRQKSDEDLEIGELLVADAKDQKVIMQIAELMYGSQISQANLELISGISLEENADIDFIDSKLRNYKLAVLKNLITISSNNASLCKTLPSFFSEVREIQKEDLNFLTVPKNPLFFGKLRSGSKVLDVDIFLNGKDVLAHHILIAATTGRGKSNLTSCMLWDSVNKDYCGILVLDPHDEYYGRNKEGLKDHFAKANVVYYTPKNPPSGCRTLKINLKDIKPTHFNGVANWSDPQKEALYSYFKKYKEDWIQAVALDKELDNFKEGTIGVVKRRIMSFLNLQTKDGELFCKGVFDTQSGESTIKDIVSDLEEAKTVIIDTSSFSGSVEILIGSLIATEILSKYKQYKYSGELKFKPVISIILEEAPRVLGKEVLEKGSNIFATIAREGRKFKVGLTAITQLPSLIPRQILANMNTKIILGLEMAPERQAIIESAAQDLSADNRNIAALDKGEAVISSNFARFATPIKIPLFEDIAKQEKEKDKYQQDFGGVEIVK